MKHCERSGKYAIVHYRGGAVGNKPIEDYSDGEPIQICIGVGSVPRGIDEALYEMEIGESRTVRIPPEKAYGNHDPQGVQLYPRSFIINGNQLQAGDIFAWTNPVTEKDIPVQVIAADQDYVQIDFNHPLAGKELEYWIELINIR